MSAQALDINTGNIRIKSDRNGVHIQTNDSDRYYPKTYKSNPGPYQKSCNPYQCCNGDERMVQQNVQIMEPGRRVSQSRIYTEHCY